MRILALRHGLALALATSAALGQPSGAEGVRRWTREFTKVIAACERSDGSVVATDAAEPAIVLIAADGSSRSLGRRGNGPGEFQSPGACFGVAADTVLVFDGLINRFVVVAPNGSTATLTYPRVLGGGWHEPVGIDETGALLMYGRATGGRAPLLRWDRRRDGVDTVTSIATGEAKSMSVGAMSLSRPIPFGPRSAVVGARTLGVAIVNAEPFRVDVMRGAALRTGEPIPFAPIAVDDGDIDRFIAANSPPPGTVGRSSTGQQVLIGQQKRTLENFGLTRADFPQRKPAFDHERVRVAPDGAVWVGMNRPSAERAERYEVIEANGRRGVPVTLAEDRRLVGVGRSRTAYVVVSDIDGLQFIERVAAPK